MNSIKITFSPVSCPCCERPLVNTDRSFPGVIRNRILSLQAELLHLRNRAFNPAIEVQIVAIENELAELTPLETIGKKS